MDMTMFEFTDKLPGSPGSGRVVSAGSFNPISDA